MIECFLWYSIFANSLLEGSFFYFMKLLEEKIISDGLILDGDILKVDNFLNHQMDTRLLDEMGKEFKRLFNDKKITKILTIESSGIGISVMASRYFDYCPVIFAKKGKSANVTGDVYECRERSSTRNVDYNVQVSKKYLDSSDTVLIIDDFLANGEALNALISICHDAKANIAGCGIVITKAYQKGEKRILDMGIEVKSLARIVEMKDGEIKFG